MLHSLTKHTRWRAIWKWIKMSPPFQIVSSYLSSTLSFRLHIAKDESDDTERKFMKCMKYQDPHPYHNHHYHHHFVILMIWSGQAVKLQVSRQYLFLHILPSRCHLQACVTYKWLSRLSPCRLCRSPTRHRWPSLPPCRSSPQSPTPCLRSRPLPKWWMRRWQIANKYPAEWPVVV